MERIPGIGKRDESGGAWRWLLLLLAGAGVAYWLKQRGVPAIGAGTGAATAGVTTWQPTPRASATVPPSDLEERKEQTAASSDAGAAEAPVGDDAAGGAPPVTSGAADPGEARPDAAGVATEEEAAERASDRGATIGVTDESGSVLGIARPAEPESEPETGGETGGGGDAGPVVVDEAPAGFAALDDRGFVEGDGSADCPEGYPIKGNATSRIYHRPGESSYAATKPEVCFATEEDAEAAGYRPRAR